MRSILFLNKHIKTLNRRLDHLNHLLKDREHRTDLSYIVAERDALEWVLDDINRNKSVSKRKKDELFICPYIQQW